jgi:transcriptional regulator
MTRGIEDITSIEDGLANELASVECRRLIDCYPLAWVCADGGRRTCLLPLVGQYDNSDQVTEIVGHFARSNPLSVALEQNPNVTFLFTGPQGYISPRMTQRPDWGPTWNYAQLSVEAVVRVDDSFTAEAVELLTQHIEGARQQPWSIVELADRYDFLIRQIVGFRASVTRVTAHFKLGQNEKIADLRNILANMPEGELRDWMIRFNRGRLSREPVS